MVFQTVDSVSTDSKQQSVSTIMPQCTGMSASSAGQSHDQRTHIYAKMFTNLNWSARHYKESEVKELYSNFQLDALY